MKSIKTKLVEALRSYYRQLQYTGLCYHLDNYPILNDWYELGDLFKKYATRWPKVLKDSYGEVRPYMIPSGTETIDSIKHYNRFSSDQRRMPERLELANFILREIARETKTKFVPIEFKV